MRLEFEHDASGLPTLPAVILGIVSSLVQHIGQSTVAGRTEAPLLAVERLGRQGTPAHT